MNSLTKWIGIIFTALGMVGMLAGYMLFVADGRFFPLGEGILLTERSNTGAKIQKENYKAIKKLNSRQTDMEKKWLRKEIDELKRKNRNLQLRRRGQ